MTYGDGQAFYDDEGAARAVYDALGRNGWEAPATEAGLKEWEAEFGVEIRLEGVAPFEEVRSHREKRPGDSPLMASGRVLTLVGAEVTHRAVHRDIEGEHVLDGGSCWCRPYVETVDGDRPAREVVAELERADG